MNEHERICVETKYLSTMDYVITEYADDFLKGLNWIAGNVGILFRVVGDLDTWNEVVEEEWAGFDDDIFYHFEQPFIHDREWYGYNENGELLKAEELIEHYKATVDYWDKLVHTET